MVCSVNIKNFQIKHKYSIKDNDDVKLSLAYIRKMKNTAKSETSAIDKTILSTKTIIDTGESDVNVRKIWVL